MSHPPRAVVVPTTAQACEEWAASERRQAAQKQRDHSGTSDIAGLLASSTSRSTSRHPPGASKVEEQSQDADGAGGNVGLLQILGTWQRCLGILAIIRGFMTLIAFGYAYLLFIGSFYLIAGIWGELSKTRHACVMVSFVVFSILSAILAPVHVGVEIVQMDYDLGYWSPFVHIISCIGGLAEFIISITSVVYCCKGRCCRSNQTATPGHPPNTYLVAAILSTVCCCLPFGLVAIVQASRVNSRWAEGDIAGAGQASLSAKRWSIITTVIGGILSIVIIIWVFATPSDYSSSSNSDLTNYNSILNWNSIG